MKNFRNLFTKYLTEQPAPAAPPKPDVKPDVKPDTKPTPPPTKEPKRRAPYHPRPGLEPRPKGTYGGSEEEEKDSKKNRNPYTKYFLQYRKNLGRK